MADKKLANLTKYFICSEHFTEDAFQNPEVEDKSLLRLNKIPSFPNPSIFEDNLMQTVETVKHHSEKFINYSKAALCDVSKKNNTSFVMKHPPVSSTSIYENTRLEPPVAEVQEETFGEVSEQDMMLYEEFIEETTEAVQAESEENMDDYCRLCVTCAPELIPIFNNKGKLYKLTQCLSLMPPGMINVDDGLPQYVCQECLTKLRSCVNIIDNFVDNQNLFTSQ